MPHHLSKFVADLNSRGIHFRTADGSADTSTSNGRLLLNILSSIAEFERDLIIGRTRAGLANARKNGKRLGPPVKWQPEMVKQARRLMERGRSDSPGSRQHAEGVAADALQRPEVEPRRPTRTKARKSRGKLEEGTLCTHPS